MWTLTIGTEVNGKHMEQKLQFSIKQQATGCYLTFQNEQLLFLNKSQYDLDPRLKAEES